jgi:hypothetical protein
MASMLVKVFQKKQRLLAYSLNKFNQLQQSSDVIIALLDKQLPLIDFMPFNQLSQPINNGSNDNVLNLSDKKAKVLTDLKSSPTEQDTYATIDKNMRQPLAGGNVYSGKDNTNELLNSLLKTNAESESIEKNQSASPKGNSVKRVDKQRIAVEAMSAFHRSAAFSQVDAAHTSKQENTFIANKTTSQEIKTTESKLNVTAKSSEETAMLPHTQIDKKIIKKTINQLTSLTKNIVSMDNGEKLQEKLMAVLNTFVIIYKEKLNEAQLKSTNIGKPIEKYDHQVRPEAVRPLSSAALNNFIFDNDIAELINRVLIEEAKRHGVNIS